MRSPLASYGEDGSTTLSPGDVREHRVEALAVLARCPKSGTVHGPDDERGDGLAAEHVAKLGGLIEDLVEAHAHEVDEHQLGNGPQASNRRARRGANEGAFANRGIEDALAPELRHQALCHTQRAAPRVLLSR